MLKRVLKLLLTGKGNIGWCPLCERATLFLKETPWLREHYRCLRCKSISRQRALLEVLNMTYPNWRELTIHESSPGGVSSDKIQRECAHYLPTQYFPDVQSGCQKQGVRCENLEQMTFEDATFDLILTQDVFEHVLNPDRAFAEIARILKAGGAHLFTMPYYPHQPTVIRAIQTADGIQNLHEPLYHGNPIDAKGSLVTRDWGDDFVDFIYLHSGLITTIHTLHYPRRGIEATFLEVFVSRKR